MSVDAETVKKVAKLARVAMKPEEVQAVEADLNRILAWVDALQAVEVEGVEPMTSVTPMRLKRRADVVTDGGDADRALGNAPETAEGFFVVPKVVE